jgi:nucleoid-associated protein YgaU
MRRIGIVAAAALSLAVLGMCRPAPAGGAGPQTAIVATAAWTAWLAATYLAAGVGLAAATTRSQHAAGLPLPTGLRRLVHRAVGAGAAAAVLGSGLTANAPVWADAHRPHPQSISATWPVAPQPRHPAGVVVEPGDCLWTLAADALDHPSAAQVAATWPRWWRTNRAVIGSDPDLIQPGQRLRPPNTPRSST